MFNPQNQKIKLKRTSHTHIILISVSCYNFFLVNFSKTFQRLTCDIYVENLNESMHVS